MTYVTITNLAYDYFFRILSSNSKREEGQEESLGITTMIHQILDIDIPTIIKVLIFIRVTVKKKVYFYLDSHIVLWIYRSLDKGVCCAALIVLRVRMIDRLLSFFKEIPSALPTLQIFIRISRERVGGERYGFIYHFIYLSLVRAPIGVEEGEDSRLQRWRRHNIEVYVIIQKYTS